jgi:hypothetical protein
VHRVDDDRAVRAFIAAAVGGIVPQNANNEGGVIDPPVPPPPTQLPHLTARRPLVACWSLLKVSVLAAIGIVVCYLVLFLAAFLRRELESAASNGPIEDLRYLLVYQSYAAFFGSHSIPPLVLAAAHGHALGVDFLLKQAAVIDVNAMHMGGHSALMAAAFHDHAAIVSVLLADKRVDVTAHSSACGGLGNSTALVCAAMAGHVDVMRVLVADSRIDPNAHAPGGLPPLLAAAVKGEVRAVALLLSRRDWNIDVNAQAFVNRTALDLAAQYGHGLSCACCYKMSG